MRTINEIYPDLVEQTKRFDYGLVRRWLKEITGMDMFRECSPRQLEDFLKFLKEQKSGD